MEGIKEINFNSFKVIPIIPNFQTVFQSLCITKYAKNKILYLGNRFGKVLVFKI